MSSQNRLIKPHQNGVTNLFLEQKMNKITFLAVLLGYGIACADENSFPIAEPGTSGIEIIVGSTDPVVATYRGNSAQFSNDLYLMLDNSGNPGNDGNTENDKFLFNNHASQVGSTIDLGSFPIGTKLVFRLHVNDSGQDYFTGPGKHNPDSHAHARVQAYWTPQETLVSFEDLYDGPFDFNDLSYSFSNVRAKDISINKAWISPAKVKKASYINVFAQISGTPNEIGEVTFLLGNNQVAVLTDVDGDGTWAGQYQVVENPGYKATTRIYVKDLKGKIVAKWPGFTVSK